MPRKVRERTADSWATALKRGTPDYVPETIVTKPVLGILEESWSVLWTPVNVAAGGSVSSDVYTVPSGYRLHITGAVVTCEASCIQMVRIVHTLGIVGDYRYDMKGELPFLGLSAVVVVAGDIITVYLFNNDTVIRDFSIVMMGVLERV